MAKAKKANSSSKDTSESEGEPPNVILFQERTGTLLGNISGRDYRSSSKGSQAAYEDLGDLVIWISDDPETVAVFDRSSVGNYSAYGQKSYPSSDDQVSYLSYRNRN